MASFLEKSQDMFQKRPFKYLFTISLLALSSSSVFAATCTIVAAENFYGSVAQEIAGSSAEVMSIMSNPAQDPHDFQSDAKTAKAIADADIIIYNGLGYDTWIEKLLSTAGKKERLVICVATLTGHHEGDNPHLWYDPKTMPLLAEKLAVVLKRPEAGASFMASIKPLLAKIESLKTATPGWKVTATEPLFGYMATSLGWTMLNIPYQEAIMNDTDPSFEQTVAFEKSLKTQAVKILFENSQASNPSTKRLHLLAERSHIPVIELTETEPLTAKNYVSWMLSELEKIEQLLKK